MRGGKRDNSGRKLKYGEEMKAITVRVPKSKIGLFSQLFKRWISRFEDKV